MNDTLSKMNEKQEAREKLDNAMWDYINLYTDADMVDYSVSDRWLEEVTGAVNPLEENI